MLPAGRAEERSEKATGCMPTECGCMHTDVRAVLTDGPDAQGYRNARTHKRAAGCEMRNANGESGNPDSRLAEVPEWKLGGLHS